MRLWTLLLTVALGVSCAAEPLCFDGIRSGDETDVDCGGSCAAHCAIGQACVGRLDCQSGVCLAGSCAAPSCSDRTLNGPETDVDCGGGCSPCPLAAMCRVAADCRSGECQSGRCAPSPITGLTPARGPTQGGTLITISGMGFAGGAPPTVMIGGTAASSITVMSDGTLTAATPPRTTAGPVDLTVQLASGRSYTLPAAFNYFYGKVAFAPRIDYPIGLACDKVKAADLNGDGKRDLVMECGQVFCADTVAVLLGKGDGTFESAKTYPVGQCLGQMQIAELSGDKNPDVAVPVTGRNGLVVLLGNGDGTLNAPVSYATGDYPLGLIAVDLNRDGRADLVSANLVGRSISVLFNKGDGTFNAKVDYPLQSASPVEVDTADFDGNGAPDIVVGSRNLGIFLWMLNNSNGVLTATRTVQLSSPVQSLAIADWNGDGIPDGVWGSATDYTNISMVLSRSDGTFGAAMSLPPYCYPGVCFQRTSEIILADFDQDGSLDVVGSGYGTSNVGVQLVKAGGVFGELFDLPNTRCYGNAAADFDGDGRVDLAMACLNTMSVNLFFNRAQ